MRMRIPAARIVEGGLLVTIIGVLIAAAVPLLRGPKDNRDSVVVGVSGATDTAIAVIVSSNCAACSNARVVNQLAGAIRRIRVSRGPDSHLRLIGVALDGHPDAGYEYLRRLGPFDEISSGGAWGNYVFSDLVWETSSRIAVVPQVLVIERVIEQGDRLHIASRTVKFGAMGATGVIEWLERYVSGEGS